MADRFYTPQPLVAGSFILDGPEAHHLAAVRRLVPGDRVTLFNGDGRDYPALILSVDRKQVLLDIHTGVAVERELPVRIEFAAALPKGDRGDFLIEKLTELGVARFTPLITDRTVVLPKDGRLDRLTRGVIEASKQCGRAVLMQIGPPATWNDYLGGKSLPANRWLLHPTETTSFPPFASEKARREGVAVAIGPEGGWTEEEVAAAVAAGWMTASLGPRVLRVETAALAVAAVLAVNSLAGPVSPTPP